MRGYMVRKKNIYYYKCSTKGCNNNRNANFLNERFAEILEWLALDESSEGLKVIEQQAVATFNQYSKVNEDKCMAIENSLAELNKKITRLEERSGGNIKRIVLQVHGKIQRRKKCLKKALCRRQKKSRTLMNALILPSI